MKFVLPHGGYGLGNELIPWAKGYILAQVLGAKLLHPAWGNNPRKYNKYFRTFRYDYIVYRVLRRTLPRFRFSEADYRSIGINDFAESCRVFAKESGLNKKKHYVIEITGFWGAFEGLASAKNFILGSLLNTAYTQGNLFSISNRIQSERLTVGIHVRLGDFVPAGHYNYEGKEQTSIDLEWYKYLCDTLVDNLGENNIQFLICSDGNPSQLKGLADRENAVFLSQMPGSDISDMLALRDADLLICSISSFSMWAAFLSRSPYVWFRENLVDIEAGLANRFIRSLGILPDQGVDQIDQGRCVALGKGDSLPPDLLNYLNTIRINKSAKTDLVRGGAIKRQNESRVITSTHHE